MPTYRTQSGLLMEAKIQSHGWDISEDAEDLRHKHKKALEADARKLLKTYKTRLLAMGYKTTNMGVHENFDGLLTYTFHIQAMSNTAGRSPEEAEKYIKGAVGSWVRIDPQGPNKWFIEYAEMK